MNQRRALPLIGVPLALTVILLCARLATVPPLTDPVRGTVSPSLHLVTPWLYFALAPAFTLWDGLSMLSMSRLQGFLTGLAVLYLIWRAVGIARRRGTGSGRTPLGSILAESLTLVISLALLLAFLAAGALWHRPMLSLAGTDPDDAVVDFHSHTKASHDVQNTWMRGFDAEANRRWHARAGFDAAFITDHNTVEPLGEGKPVLCPGIEVSAWRAHIVLLGDSLPVDRSRYNSSLDALLALLGASDSAYGALSVASLPEYRRSHWDHLDRLVAAGLDGFEIVNASPKANELRQAERDTVIALARSRNRFVVGASDSHGWGSTSMVWNLVRVPRLIVKGDLCAAVIRRLHEGFPAVQVIERHRLRPDSWWPGWLTPLGVVWETWRSMGWGLSVAWLVWVWGIAALLRRRTSAGPKRPASTGPTGPLRP